MMSNNPKLDLVNINAYLKFGEILKLFVTIEHRSCQYECLVKFCQFVLKISSRNKILLKFCQFVHKILSGNDIEWKRNSGLNQGPLLWYKCVKNDE